MAAVKVIAVVVALYGAIVLAAFLMQRSLMYFPGRALPPVPEPFTELALPGADGASNQSWYRPAASPTHAVIVYFQGNAGTIADRVLKLLPFIDDGHGVLLVGYRGYGGNPGRPTEVGLIADGRAALQFLVDENMPPQRVVLLGESLGSGVAVALAAERPFAAVILEAPFTSAADVGQAAYPFLPVKLLIKDRFDSQGRIGRIRAPLLIVHGEGDRVVPVTHGRRLLDAAPEPKQGHFLPNAGHNDLAAHGATELEREFLRTVLAEQ